MVENRFPKIWVPTVAERDLRQLLMHRHHLVRMRTRVKNQLQHIALNQGVQKKYKLWPQAGLKVLRELELEPWTRLRRERCCRCWKSWSRRSSLWSGRWSKKPKPGRRRNCWRRIPESAPVIALATVLTMGEVKRFANSRSWVSYLGLNPSERSSGEKRREWEPSANKEARFEISPGARRRERRARRQELGPNVCPTEGQEAPRCGQSSSGP